MSKPNASGDVDASDVFTYRQDVTADPALPADIPVGEPFTVDGAIVAAIVDAHSGRVSAANASAGGAVFSVVLPPVGL